MNHFLYFLGLFFTVTFCNAQQPGTFDGDFSADGIGYYDVPDYEGGCTAKALAIQPDGKIIVAGGAAQNAGQLNTNVALMCLNPDGGLDVNFGNQTVWNAQNNYFATIGITIEDAQVVSTTANAVVVLPNGSIVVGTTYYTGEGFALQGFYSSGWLDEANFGNDGTVITNFGSYARLYALTTQSDGKIIAAGEASDGGSNTFAISRYYGNGGIDYNFSFDGKVTTNFGSNGASARAVAVQPDGKIVAAGSYSVQCALARYNSDGTLDNSFGSNGKVLTAIGDESFINAIVIQPNGKIVVAGGSISSGFQGNYTLVRYNTNGTLDASFGVGGITTVSDGFFTGIAIQPDGKIVATGSRLTSQTIDVVRFNANGTRDNTFGVQGFAYPVYGAEGRAIGIQPDGKIVAAGISIGGTPNWKFCVVRYLSGLNVGVVNPLNPATETLIYPNPINTEAAFEFELETAARVTLSVYNLNGQLMLQPVANEKLEAGSQKRLLMLNSLTTGTYLLVLQAGQQTVSTQFVKQ